MEKLVKKAKQVAISFVLVFLSVFIAIGEVSYLNGYHVGEVLGESVSAISNNLIIGETKDSEGNIKISEKIQGNDARPVIIKKYLEKYNSPLLPYSDLIYEVSKTYGLDYYWIVAIAQQESNLCKKAPEDSHNCWGYGIHKRGTLKFDNYELAIKSYAEYLKREYFDKGLNTPELIMKKYCPSSNGSWARGVQQFIDEMESGTF
jgi:hypothetical protein